MSGRCDHGELEIVSLTPLAPGWGMACCFEPERDEPELDMLPVVALAHVRRDVSMCTCAETALLPVTPGFTFFEALEERAEDEHVDHRLVAPGQRPVLRRHSNGRCSIALVSGSWTPGLQEVADLPPRRKSA